MLHVHVWLPQRALLPPPTPTVGTLDFCKSPAGFLMAQRLWNLAIKIPPRRKAGVSSSWTQSNFQLKLNLHLFYRTGKPRTAGSSESACHPDIQSLFRLTECGTRPGTHAPGEKQHCTYAQQGQEPRYPACTACQGGEPGNTGPHRRGGLSSLTSSETKGLVTS